MMNLDNFFCISSLRMFGLLLLWGGPVSALELALPVLCHVGEDCFVQNLVDNDPGPGVADYQCGSLSYEGHTGTDFRVANLQVMRTGVPVIAAADGVVRAIREGEPDISVRQRGREAIRGREAGNAVVLTHPDGWETLYGHLRLGSVRVEQGQRVKRGDILGLIGLSGLTEFPHVHFSVRRHGEVIDPFTGHSAQADICDGASPDRDALWQANLKSTLAYQPTAILAIGFTSAVPDARQQRDQPDLYTSVLNDPPALIIWADIMGPRKGEQGRLQITGPDGVMLIDQVLEFSRDQAQRFVYAGRKRPPDGWLPGRYVGTISLTAEPQAQQDQLSVVIR